MKQWVSPDSAQVLAEENAALKAENARLRQINAALIDRVEAAPDVGGRAYAAFEHSALLAEQVRERTAALNKALADLQASNQALQNAHVEIETLHKRLVDAIESMNDAFVLFDSDRKLVLCNSRYRQIWQGYGFDIKPGATLSDISHYGQRILLNDTLVQEELSLYRQAYGQVICLRNGCWLQVNQRDTATGDLAILYTDITQLKAIETERREQALAAKSRTLQSTLENLSQGVILISEHWLPEVWNRRLTELTGLTDEALAASTDFLALIGQQFPASGSDGFRSLSIDQIAHSEIIGSDGTVLEIRQKKRPEGGRVITLTDITERSRFARALQQSEQKMRLITDALPVMICYVNAQLTFEFTNKAYQQWHGCSKEALLGTRLDQVYPYRQLKRLRHYIDRVLQGHQVSFEVDETNSRGGLRYLHKTYVPHLNRQGVTQGFFVLTQDITERRRTAQALKDANASLEQANVSLEQRVAERTAALSEAKHQAEDANISKTKFLAAISHDLLQPINAARLFNSALLDQPLADNVRRLVRSTETSLNDVESLIRALVDISKLDAGVVEPQFSTFNLYDFLQGLCHEYRELTACYQQSFRARLGRFAVYSDSHLLSRILRNLLTNACRYTPPGGQVMLATRRRSDSLLIEVWDTGDGIAPEKLDDIFREFSRLQPASNAASDKGLGLGLAIVDKIARVLEHPVSVRSVPGRGSVFRVRVPLSASVPAKERSLDALPHTVNQLQSRPVLVLDNDAAICAGMEQLLDGWGMDVMTAQSCQEALCLLEDGFVPELMLLDYHLDDDCSGLAASEQLQQRLPFSVPVIMVTANHSRKLRLQAGEKRYPLMHKPVKPMKLRSLMIQML